jgi:hypothetical protein
VGVLVGWNGGTLAQQRLRILREGIVLVGIGDAVLKVGEVIG